MPVNYDQVAYPPSPTPDDIFDFNSTTMSANKKQTQNSRVKYSANSDVKVSSIPRSVKYVSTHRHSRNFSLSRTSELTPSPTETTPPLSPQNTGRVSVIDSTDLSDSKDSVITVKDQSTVSLNGVDLSVDFPYLRATHSFEPKTLFEQHNMQQDATSVCLSFEHSDVVILHSVHPSGWGDATLLSNGRRGWIPTNFFTPYVETQAVSLLAAVLTFIINPRSLDIVDESSKDTTKSTFSQTSINNIVAGVRSLLEMCNTLTRDSLIVKRSPSIRKFRKSLLTELALLVSVAKQNHNSTDSLVIEKLLHGCYKIVIKAVIFLDVWQIETDAKSKLDDDEEEGGEDETKSVINGQSPSRSSSFSQLLSAAKNKSQSSMNRASVIFLKNPPFASDRLEEVNEALTTYLGIFIHRTSILQTDPSASSQILFNTRKSMLACRELLACVEAISAQVGRDSDLEQSKDTLYQYIRELVKVAREVANISLQDFENNDERSDLDRSSQRKLVNTAVDCVRSAGECVVRSRNILQQTEDFHLTAAREYPDFASGLMTNDENTSVRLSTTSSSLKYETETDGYETATTTPIHSTSTQSDDSDDPNREAKSALPHESNSDAPPVHYDTDDDHQNEDDAVEEVFYDDFGNLRGATAHAYLSMLVDGDKSAEPPRISAFYLTFRTFMKPEEVLDTLFNLYEPDVDVECLEDAAKSSLTKRRHNIFRFVERWMKSHWIATSDDPVLEKILEFSGSRFDSTVSHGDELIRNLAMKLQDASSEPVVHRLVDINNETEFFKQRDAVPAFKKPYIANLSKAQINALQKFYDQQNKSDDEQETSKRQSSVSNWAASLRRGSNANLAVASSSSLHLPSLNGESGISILDFDSADIACQLTYIGFQYFVAITPNELVDQNFSLKKRERGLAPNVAKMSTLSNSLSSFVGDTILRDSENNMTNKIRSKVLKQWIKIADKCCELGNFDATIAILSVLQSVNITRLKKIWDMLPTKTHTKLDNLKYLLIPDRNFSGYRQKLRTHALPAIPYLGLYFTDLTFVEEGNSKFKKVSKRSSANQPKIINLDRCDRIARLVGEFQRYQASNYNITPCKELQFWMRTEMTKSHDKVSKDQQALWRRSCILEPR